MGRALNLEFKTDFAPWLDQMDQGLARLANLVPAHERIGDILVEEIQSNFVSGGGIRPWRELADTTLEKRAREGYGDEPLLKTRELFSSIEQRASHEWAEAGSTIFYSWRLFLGSTPGIRPMTPERNPFVFDLTVFQEFVSIYFDHLWGRGQGIRRMIPTVSKGQVIGAMVTHLQATMQPQGGGQTQPVTPGARYLRKIDKYTGEFTAQEGMQAGISDLSALVAFVSERTIRTTIGRRVDVVEGVFAVIAASPSARSREDRAFVFQVLQDVRKNLGARAFGLPMRPLRWQRDDLVRDDKALLAYASRFATRYRVDYTINPGTETIEVFDGSMFDIDNPTRLYPVKGVL